MRLGEEESTVVRLCYISVCNNTKTNTKRPTTFSSLCASPVIESANSRPAADSFKLANSAVFGSERAKIPKAEDYQQYVCIGREMKYLRQHEAKHHICHK